MTLLFVHGKEWERLEGFDFPIFGHRYQVDAIS